MTDEETMGGEKEERVVRRSPPPAAGRGRGNGRGKEEGLRNFGWGRLLIIG